MAEIAETANIYAGLTNDQTKASAHIGKHARLLAGPGTGKTKTMTNRVLSLVLKHGVEPKSILILTFTRLAAAQLRNEVGAILQPLGKDLPNVATLHGFALRQILFNSGKVETLPSPIRIADDWEERNIIQEDLKRALVLKKIDQVQDLIEQLSTDWETLRADEKGWEQQFPNAAFIGAWKQHRTVFGYTLRAELVYQLKRALNQSGQFKLDREYKHVLIDEYQDLNACDLAIIYELAKSAELFVAGDDDQSIYGFRYADPVGIRQFAEIFPGTEKLALEICFRCDKSILKTATFVADLDPKRLPKPTRPRDDAADGTVELLCFKNQDSETAFVVGEIQRLIQECKVPGDKIAVLLRGDKNGAMSKPIIEHLQAKEIKVAKPVESELTDSGAYRAVLSYLRLYVDPEDSLAQRTLLQVSKNGIGEVALEATLQMAKDKGKKFSEVIYVVAKNPGALPKFGNRLAECWKEVTDRIHALKELATCPEQLEFILNVIGDGNERDKIKKYFEKLIADHHLEKLEDLLKVVSAADRDIEQETEEGAVNILTMHQAKGLTFDSCFIVGVEDEVIPGRNDGESMGDERRLLYVSMTRAKHRLYMTYCSERTGAQSFIGRKPEKKYRQLSRFLRDSPLKVKQV